MISQSRVLLTSVGTTSSFSVIAASSRALPNNKSFAWTSINVAEKTIQHLTIFKNALMLILEQRNEI